MKKTHLIHTALSALLLFAAMLPSCGHSDSSTADTADSTALSEPESSSAPSEILLCADSIYTPGGAALAIGTRISDIPEQIPGIYDNIESTAGHDIREFHFKNGEDYLFTALDFGEGRIDLIMTNSADVKVAGAPSPITLTSPFTEVLSLPGSAPEWVDMDDTGMWYWTWEGLWFAPDQSHLPEALSRHLYNEESLPGPADFNSEVAIGYMATGIPF